MKIWDSVYKCLYPHGQSICCVFGYNLIVMKNHLYKMSLHVLDIYQWIQSGLSHTYFLSLLSWTYSMLIIIWNWIIYFLGFPGFLLQKIVISLTQKHILRKDSLYGDNNISALFVCMYRRFSCRCRVSLSYYSTQSK